jgi:peptidoglycan L-alanyl-D-glutamate endopeptidase CwlK
MITLDKVSLLRLEGVHPDLDRVVRAAANMAAPHEAFMVIEGVRSREGMMINYGKGRTVAQITKFGIPASYARPAAKKVTWLSNPFMSNHRVHDDGYGHAVDLGPYPLNWNDAVGFAEVVALMKRAAAEEDVKITCGADWTRQDRPHFELA